eukprot:m.17893 g.17893  ORF g.17893 m.17893 type:complete len:215 (-) comp10711_c0_seq1:63-707(-)
MAAKLYAIANQRGQAEAIRMMFAEAKIPFTEVPVTEADLATLDQSGALMFGDLPMVEIDGMQLPGQAAIIEYLAQLADSKSDKQANKFLGSNENERSTARSLCAAAYDLRRSALRMLKNRNATTEKAFKTNVVPEWFAALNKMAVASSDEDKGLGDGVHFTFGDLAMFEAVNCITSHLKISIIRPYPSLKEWHDKAVRRPAIEAYLTQRSDATW